jgi:26S proteasome regulatory subunit N5
VLFVVLAPFDNEQSDLIQRVYIEADEVDTPVYRYDIGTGMTHRRSFEREVWNADIFNYFCIIVGYRDLLKCFITTELMRWAMIEQIYGPTLGQNTALATGDEASRKRLKELHNRVVEHVSTFCDTGQ